MTTSGAQFLGMPAEPGILVVPAERVACLSLVVPAAEMQAYMDPAMQELFSTVMAQGLTVTGPWFTHHRRRPTDTFDFDICVPVDRTPTARGRVRAGERAQRRVARMIHGGPYETLAASWRVLGDWLVKKRHTPAPDLWERYLVGPEAVADPKLYLTELNRPLLD